VTGYQVHGLKVLVTGAASGIGREVARRFIIEGAEVAVTDIVQSLAATAAEIGARTATRGDVAREEDAARIMAGAVSALGGLDCLINVAGLQIVGRVEETVIADWDRLMAVNLRGPFLMVKAALPHLRKSDRASIINTASVAGLRGGPGSTAYSASKAGLIGFTTALALELAPEGITVNSVCPGWVDTGFNAPIIAQLGGAEAHAALVRSGVPLGRQGQADDLAPTFLHLASPGARYLTAQALIVDGGVHN
jgi:NAD(P)-dependent dehydrogenase (short-subunit alcohol dehydrogenase family)